ncbi:hypothetical protein [Ancylobacter sp. TS-1]|uniref:hypothetical protein n=1 Tax=Ancylobacter sp. TS-1 TaxID=1850374 RepID=UPI001265B57D|nr:hypothetical protein [Ancylobacter sp. TS-1]QFR32406.1 hypothetical protein GBB76_04340 [Ancylobacter sp. TS-1]
MHRSATALTPPPPLVAIAERRRIGEMLRERALLQADLLRLVLRRCRRVETQRRIDQLTREILMAEIALGGKHTS